MAVIVWSLRLPRALACILVGAILGMTGAAFQYLFRNPLAEPYLVGASGGAALGGALVLVTGAGGILGGIALMAGALVGALATLALVLVVASSSPVRSTANLLLSGVVVGSLASALMTILLIMSGSDANRILAWLFGSMSQVQWWGIAWLLGALLAIGVSLRANGRALNAIALGEESARHLGVDPGRVQRLVILFGAAATAISVGAVGIIGFLGLIAPHLARPFAGTDMRRLLVASALTGSAVLLLADAAAQRMIGVVEVPVGALMAIFGAPMLLAILRRTRLAS